MTKAYSRPAAQMRYVSDSRMDSRVRRFANLHLRNNETRRAGAGGHFPKFAQSISIAKQRRTMTRS
jgi:hypothetical protein